MSDKEGREIITASFEIFVYGVFRRLCQIDNTELASLASYCEFERVEIDIISIEGGQLRYSQSRRIDTLRDGIVTLTLDRITHNISEESLYLFMGEKCHFSILCLHQIERRGIETSYLFLLQILEPTPDRDDVSIHRLHRESCICE